MNNPVLPLNLIVMTSTKGHYDRHDIYKNTVRNLNERMNLSHFANRFCNIKVDQENAPSLREMEEFFRNYNFYNSVTRGEWKHNDVSHQAGYIYDMISVLNNNFIGQGYYSLFCEDDWVFCLGDGSDAELSSYMHSAISILHNNANIVQVRIPRFNNEISRINRLKEKHNLDRQAVDLQHENYFICNDWSNNPYVCRTRDLMIALKMIRAGHFEFHSEHGLGEAMKFISGSANPFAVFKPNLIRALHIGTPIGMEDSALAELNSD